MCSEGWNHRWADGMPSGVDKGNLLYSSVGCGAGSGTGLPQARRVCLGRRGALSNMVWRCHCGTAFGRCLEA